MPCQVRRRKAFTLIELLVVIGIMTTLAALTAVYFVTFGKSEQAQRGADQLSGWVLSARQQARRDGRPYGLLFVDAAGNPLQANAAGPVFAYGVQFIQQPDDFAQGVYLGQDPNPPPGQQSAYTAL